MHRQTLPDADVGGCPIGAVCDVETNNAFVTSMRKSPVGTWPSKGRWLRSDWNLIYGERLRLECGLVLSGVLLGELDE